MVFLKFHIYTLILIYHFNYAMLPNDLGSVCMGFFYLDYKVNPF